MAYAVYEDYAALYGEGLDEAGFDRLVWQAGRVMDRATTGVDGVAKLRVAYPEREDEAVRRCACALVERLRRGQPVEHPDGTVSPRLVTGRTAGAESVTYAAAASGAEDTALADAVREYLGGVRDANGVNLLYLGRYPAQL